MSTFLKYYQQKQEFLLCIVWEKISWGTPQLFWDFNILHEMKNIFLTWSINQFTLRALQNADIKMDIIFEVKKKLHQFHVVNNWWDVGHSTLSWWRWQVTFENIFVQHFHALRLLYMTTLVTWPKPRSGFPFRKWRMRFLSIYWAIKAQIWSIWTGAKERIYTHCVIKPNKKME